MKLKKQDGGAMLPSDHPKITVLKEYKEIKSRKSSKLLYDYELKYNESEDHSKGSVIMEPNKFATHQDLEILSQRVDHGQELVNKDLDYLKNQIADLQTDSRKQQEELLNKIDEKFQSLKELHQSQLETQSEKTKNYVTSTTYKALGLGIAAMTLIITVLEMFIL